MKLSNRWEYNKQEDRPWLVEKFRSAGVRSRVKTRQTGGAKVSGSRRDVWVLRAARAADRHLRAAPGRINIKLSSCLLFTAVCLLLVSCTPQVRHTGPSFESISLEDALVQYKKISSIDTIIGIEYEKNEAVMQGDGSLSISPDKLALRIYYLGFLQGEVYEENGEVRSKPKLERNKKDLLVNGLKSSIFWWNIKNYDKRETDDTYELRTPTRKVVLDKSSLLPISQTIMLEDGEQLSITYGLPVPRLAKDGKRIESNSPLGWYPSRLKIQLRNYIVRIDVKSYSLTK
jgi:hypothetical protein